MSCCVCRGASSFATLSEMLLVRMQLLFVSDGDDLQ